MELLQGPSRYSQNAPHPNSGPLTSQASYMQVGVTVEVMCGLGKSEWIIIFILQCLLLQRNMMDATYLSRRSDPAVSLSVSGPRASFIHTLPPTVPDKSGVYDYKNLAI